MQRFPKVATALVPLLVVLAACGEQTPTSPAVARVQTSAALVAPTTWSASGPGTVTLINDGSTGNPSMSYAMSGSSVWSTRTWSFSTTAASAGTITQNYDYSGYHAYFQVRVFMVPFVIHNAVKLPLPGGFAAGPVDCCTSPSGGFHYTGSVTFNVSAGDTFGFDFGGSNFDSDARLLGTFTVVFPALPQDVTPPVITPTVTGTLGNNDWYTSDVGISWNVTDHESAISATSGCDASTLSVDSNDATYTCKATSAGGTSSNSVTVKRDATAPVIAYAGNNGTYTVDQQVNITCSATDAMSGIASSNCPGASGPAYSFGVGTQTLSASASDNAGNGSSASTQFTVQVTPGSLCTLVRRWVSQKGVANSMCQQLANGAYGAFRNHVSAQSGKTVSSANAAILISLSQSL